MSERSFLDWNDSELSRFILKLVNAGEKQEKAGAVDGLLGKDIAIQWNTWITYLYTKAVIMQLERLNRKVDELVRKRS